mmetsp:Transcript_14948/g.49005  ORF Transcript_14948/g.49005 Transcript_14948/m.49005 type:complete len:200 (+) Transcript_14948:2641-3240(+)
MSGASSKEEDLDSASDEAPDALLLSLIEASDDEGLGDSGGASMKAAGALSAAKKLRTKSSCRNVPKAPQIASCCKASSAVNPRDILQHATTAPVRPIPALQCTYIFRRDASFAIEMNCQACASVGGQRSSIGMGMISTTSCFVSSCSSPHWFHRSLARKSTTVLTPFSASHFRPCAVGCPPRKKAMRPSSSYTGTKFGM